MPTTREYAYKLTPADKKRLQNRIALVRKKLKQIGAMIVEDARRAFQDQSFDGVRWPPKYPNQVADPFISIAGVIQDFSEGRKKPRSETLQRTPALQRTAALRRSPAWRYLSDDSIEVGSVLPYASLHQKGGISIQPVSEPVKDAIIDWLNVRKRREKTIEERFNSKPEDRFKKIVENPNAKFYERLRGVLRPSTTDWATRVNRRPFIGITHRRSGIIEELLADTLGGPEKAPI